MKALWLQYRGLVLLAAIFALAMWLAPCVAAKDRARRGTASAEVPADRWLTGPRSVTGDEDTVWVAPTR